MQQSVVPELAHTAPRPIHWVGTATAIAGVIALSSLLQPGPATAAQHHTEDRTAPAATPPDPARARFPLDCGPDEPLVEKNATGDLDGDHRPESVALVHCDAGMGTPPDALYVLAQAAGAGEPHVVATLVDPEDRLTVTDFAVQDGAVTATLLGYSSPDVPSCCPDTRTPAEWRWNGHAFIRSTPGGTRTV